MTNLLRSVNHGGCGGNLHSRDLKLLHRTSTSFFKKDQQSKAHNMKYSPCSSELKHTSITWCCSAEFPLTTPQRFGLLLVQPQRAAEDFSVKSLLHPRHHHKHLHHSLHPNDHANVHRGAFFIKRAAPAEEIPANLLPSDTEPCLLFKASS